MLFLFVAIQSQAQDSKVITEQYNAYSKLIIEKNFEKAFDYMNEGIFELAPREQLLEAMNSIMNNPELTMEMTMPEISAFTETKKIGDKYYVKFNSFNIVKIKLNTMMGPNKTAEENKTMENMMRQNFEGKYGAENVSYDEKTYFFTLKASKPVVAATVDKKDWKFITIEDESQKETLSAFIPAEMLN